MFEVGTFIVYGLNGVCKVEKVGMMESSSDNKDKLYYTLIPVYITGSRIITPVDNKKVKMRSVMKKEEVMELIRMMKQCEPLWIQDDRKREGIYKQAIKENDSAELVRMIKALYLRKESRLAEGKKATASDEKYFRLAEESLYGEFAISLDMDKKSVMDYVAECL
ncbi:CarD family transcriptional regulator [Anaerosporobacter faecicola]|uniref:CarD family transcriptional regulator n=1 Tax=Anaerosporobacter faecicola TaxID=2718714 RepID=UPI00143AC021|nr:CarD family transcriptional regulator [Anaerosporobacter faecicola]